VFSCFDYVFCSCVRESVAESFEFFCELFFRQCQELVADLILDFYGFFGIVVCGEYAEAEFLKDLVDGFFAVFFEFSRAGFYCFFNVAFFQFFYTVK